MATLKNTTVNDTGHTTVATGTTAQRPASPALGMLRYNSTLDVLEQYTTIGWQGIEPPPVILSISGTIFNNENSTITINGSNFKAGSVVSITGAAVGGIERTLSTTFVSSTQLTAATNAGSVNYTSTAGFNIKVTNPSGLSATLDNAGTIDTKPTWTTPSGLLGYISDLSRGIKTFTVVANDPDGSAITYSVVSGALPTGMTLNSSTGVISGTPNAVVSDTTSSFTIRATSNGQTIDRAFSIAVKAPGKTAFSYTGTNQTFNIPTGVDRIKVKMWGAGGGNYYSGHPGGSAGAGGYTETTFNVLAGETTLTVLVGGGGAYADGNFNPAPMGGASCGENGGSGGGGGSHLISGTLTNQGFSIRSDVGAGGYSGARPTSHPSSELSAKVGASQIIAVAGGGGGAGWYVSSGQDGGNGGGITGGGGYNGGTEYCGGGSQTAGGYGAGSYGTAGIFLRAGVITYNGSSGGSAGAGGGWYGGGTCQGQAGNNFGGGGGSGFVGYADGSTSTPLTANGSNGSYTDSITRTNGSRTYTNSQCLRSGVAGFSSPPNTGDADYASGVGIGISYGNQATGGHGRVVLIY